MMSELENFAAVASCLLWRGRQYRNIRFSRSATIPRSGKSRANCAGAVPRATLCKAQSIAMSRRDARGARLCVWSASNSESSSYRSNFRWTLSTRPSTEGAAWYKSGVELSMYESTCALYKWISSFVEKKRRDRRSVCRRHPPSMATWRAAACMRSCGSNKQPSTLKVSPKCRVQWRM